MRGVFVFPTIFMSFPLAFLLAVCQYIDMICVNCFHTKTDVANSRPHKKQPTIWRRRQCRKCGAVFTSYERAALNNIPVLQHSGKTTAFSIGKLTISIARSFVHDKEKADYASHDLAQTIETKLLLRGKSLSSDDIAAITHATLQQFDPIAALQYAAAHDLITLKRRAGRPATSYRPGSN